MNFFIWCFFLCTKCLQFRLKEYHLLNTTSAIYHSPQMSQPPMLCYIREQWAKLTRWRVNLANVARVKCLHLTSRWRFPLNNTVLEIWHLHFTTYHFSYAARSFDQLNSGEEYKEVLPVHSIGFLNFTLFEDQPEFFATYELRNKKTGHLYSSKWTG